MRRRKAVMVNVYSGNGKKFDSYVSHYRYTNIPRFKHKKKPISMIKTLDVRDSINYRKNYGQYKKEVIITFLNSHLF
ncbi:hypothetical protein [Lactococcus lactis]|uniref:hypothetical protein n=1 Tax=Lactococcus lactis TaxID=1358 RepID=UPI00111157F7|nr:hypothetical protein [Lactococcus lactis]